jgi:secreted trypsin-like serine protease
VKRLLVVLASSLFLLLSPMHAGAITGGQVDTANRYPSVGLLAFYNDQGGYEHRCTGTLVSPSVVLTAAHCTDGMALAYAYFQVVVPDDFREHPTGISGTPHTHPAFRSNTLNNDVAVVELDQPVNLAQYPTIVGEGVLSELKASHEIQGDTFVAVGYGVQTGFPPPTQIVDLQRRFSVSPYGGLTRGNLHLQQNPNSTGGGGTCFGDSGGPHFWLDTLTIVSVTSWGDAVCRSNDMTQRVDLPSVQEFLAEFGISP